MAEIAVICAHADDEALGCGGTLARHHQAGDRIRILFMTDGVGSRTGTPDPAAARDAEARRRMAVAAAALVGAPAPDFADFPDNAMDSVPLVAIAQRIEAFLAAGPRPDRVYTHHAGDLNVDHRTTNQAVLTALRPQPGRAAPTILAFEVASSTEWQAPGFARPFVPNWFEDISATLAIKLHMLDIYAAEMRAPPHARSLEALEHLARWRGATVGLAAAEAFMLERYIGK